MVLQLPAGRSETEVIAQINEHYNDSVLFTTKKRDLFQKRHKLYMNITDQENKIYNRLLFSVMQTLQSLYNMDEPSVSFSVEGLWFDEMEDNINMTAKSDFHKMKLAEKKDAARWNMFFYGPSIEVFDGYDLNRKLPTYRIMSPMTWICDVDRNINTGYRYHGFELEMDVSELTEASWYERIKELMEAEINTLVERAKKAGRDTRQLASTTRITKLGMYQAFEEFNGRKYLVSLGNGRSMITRCVEILPVTNEEKVDPSVVPSPVIVDRWMDYEFDPWGICLPDILEDKQAALQLFANLERLRAEYATWWQFFFYDPAIIKDIGALEKQWLGPKYIPVTTLKNGTPLQWHKQEGVTQDSSYIQQALKNQLFLDLGMDQRSLWSAGTGDITKGENDTIQSNANLRQIYGIKRYLRGQVKFWEFWYRSHVEFLKGKKKLQGKNELGIKEYYEFSPEQLITYENVTVCVESSIEAEQKAAKERTMYMAMYWQIIADPTKPIVSKKFAERKLLKLNGMARKEIDVICPYTADELDAMQWLELINREEMPPEIDDLEGEDHMTYVVYYQRAMNTSAKAKAIRARLEAYKASGQWQRAMAAPTQAPDKQMQWQITNQMMAENSWANKTVSLANAAPQ